MTDVKMPLTAHLEELRWRLIKALLAITVGFVATYSFADQLFAFLTRPLLSLTPGPVELIGTGVTEAFFTKLKVSFIAAIFVASPVLFYQAWMFVAPGLYDQEKRYARPFVFFATIFFVLGASFCYWVVFPVGYPVLRRGVPGDRRLAVDPHQRVPQLLGAHAAGVRTDLRAAGGRRSSSPASASSPIRRCCAMRATPCW